MWLKTIQHGAAISLLFSLCSHSQLLQHPLDTPLTHTSSADTLAVISCSQSIKPSCTLPAFHTALGILFNCRPAPPPQPACTCRWVWTMLGILTTGQATSTYRCVVCNREKCGGCMAQNAASKQDTGAADRTARMACMRVCSSRGRRLWTMHGTWMIGQATLTYRWVVCNSGKCGWRTAQDAAAKLAAAAGHRAAEGAGCLA